MTSNYHAERREIRTGGQRELEGAAVVLDPSRIQPGTNSLPNRCGGAPTGQPPQTNGSSPEHQAQLRSHCTLPNRFEFDWNTYFVDRLPALQIPAYKRRDLQLTRHLCKEWVTELLG